MSAPCKHCGRPVGRSQRRGLCERCRKDPWIRQQHLPAGSQTKMEGRDAALPDFPTEAPPGSLAKIGILARRAQARQILFHPHDADMSEPVVDEFQSPWDED